MENILEDVLKLEEEKIFPDELELSETYMESENFTESEDISNHQLSKLKHKVSKLVKLNKALNKFGYGYVDKVTGQIMDTDNDAEFSKLYHYLSPEEFEKAKGGVCYDYAEYQYRVLRKSGYNAINFYIELKDKRCSTHTFTVVKFNDFYLYLESSFEMIKGVYVAIHMKDIFNFVLNAMVSYESIPNIGYELHSYPGYDNYGCDALTFMNHMIKEEKLIMKGIISTKLDVNIRRFDESVEDDFAEDCKNLDEARNFCKDVRNIAKKYNANFFVVTDGASAYHNTGNPAVKNAREQQIKWEKKNGFDPDEDWSESDNSNIFNELLLMEGTIEHSFLLQKVVEKPIFDTLATPEGRRKYKRIQDEYINRNMEKLSTAGPMYLIVFGDNDQKAYFDLFGIDKEDIRDAMTEITKKAGANSDYKFLRQNPILVVLYFCIRYFTLEDDKQGINATLAIFALGIYWSKFTKYFPKGVIGPVMEYTIDNMTEKFMIKKCGNIFNTLVTSINQSYSFHKKRFYEGGDDDVVAFMQRISNDQNSLLKKIANEYMKNYKDGKAVTTRNDDYDPDNPIVDDVQNASTIIQNQVSKVTLPIISNGVDLVLAEASARMAGISISDCREYLVKIMVQNNLPTLESLIESILFMFIYTYGRSVREIKSQYFLAWARALFKKTNSNDKNLKNINGILEKWAEESGIYARYKREGSRINYKKGIFFYVILSIQKYS